MLAGTHRIISSIIFDNLKDEGIVIDHKKFAWGSVKPDFTLPPFRRKHYMEETLEYVADCILYAARNPSIDHYELSEKIGEVTHFLTDFFCLPHSERWDFLRSGRMMDHIIYERKLHDYAIRHFGILSPVRIEFSPEHNQTSICKWISNNHMSYKEKADYLHDLKQASGVSLAVTRWILLKRQDYMCNKGALPVERTLVF